MSDEEDMELDIVGEGPAVQPEGCNEGGVNEEGPPSAADEAAAEEAPAEAAVPQKRGRGRPRKSAGAPTPPPGPKRGPGRPSNAELLRRFANSHKKPNLEEGAEQSTPAPLPGGRRGRGRGRGRERGRGRPSPGAGMSSRLSRSSTADKHEPAGRVENGNGAAGSKAASEAGSDEPSAAARDVDDSSEAAEPDSDDSDASESLDILGMSSDSNLAASSEGKGEEEAEIEQIGEPADADDAVARAAAADKDAADDLPAEISLDRPGAKSSVTIPADAMGDAISAYMIIRAFSWQLRLSPVMFEEFAAALFANHPSPFLDEMMVCIVRALAEDENKAQRAEHGLDLALLDGVTWPDYLWDYMRLVYNPLGHLSAAPASPPNAGAAHDAPMPDRQAEAGQSQQSKHHMHALGQGVPKYGSEEAAPITARELLPKRVTTRKRRIEFYALSAQDKAAIVAAMAGYLLDVRSVRREVDRREACGQWVAGSRGEGGAFAMRSAEEAARRADAGSDDEGDPVEIGVERDGNADMCCLCNQGGSLLCCDRCPASYHMRCLGEQAKSLPEGEWACPECAVGGRGEAGGLRVPRAGLDPQKRPCWLVQAAVFCSARPQLHGSRELAEEAAEKAVPMVRLTGSHALEKAAYLKPIRREEKYLRSSLQALHEPAPQDKRLLTSAEGYLNRYRNGWAASAAAVKAWVDEAVRRRGKPVGGQAPVPLNELPVPVPISRFLWPFGQGKGARPTEKCGVCVHCTRPALRKGCLNPIVKSENPDEAYNLAAKLQTLVNYALKAERELWGLLDGPWDGPSYADHRRTWSSQVRSATRVEQVAACMLQLEACLRRGALIKDWDPLARLAARKAMEAGRVVSEALPPAKEPVQEPAAPVATPQPTTPHADVAAPGTSQTEADEAGAGRRTRERRQVDYKEPSVLDMQSGVSGADRARASAAPKEEADELLEFDFKADRRIVENEATKKAAHWTVNNKSLWARFTGRQRLPQKLAKKAARQSGRKPVPGLVYSQKAPGIALRQAWTASMEAAVTCPELAVALRQFDAAVLWDSAKRPVEDGKWTGVQLLGRRPGAVPHSWQYLTLGGPVTLPEAKEAVMNAHGTKEPGAQGLPTPFAAAEEQSTLQTPPQPVPLPGRMPRPPTPLSPMRNGMVAVTPWANGPMQPSLTPEVLRKLLLANGIPEGAAAMGSERDGAHAFAANGARQGLAPITPAWLSMAHAVIAATAVPKLTRPAIGQPNLPTEGLASLVPPAPQLQLQLQGQLQARASKPLVYWPKGQQAGQARWVAEADLPLWLVRGHEEKARRDAALAASEAERLAAREVREVARSGSAAAAAAGSDTCALCGGGEDADRDTLWVECGSCTRWYHGSCAGATQEDLDALGDAEWECPECQISRRAKQERRQPRRQPQQLQLQEKAQAAGVRVRSRASAARRDAPKAAEEPEYKKVYKPRKPRAERTVEEQREIEEEDAAAAAELYCLCQQADDPGAPRDWVQCDKCAQWFHPECVGTTAQAVEGMEEWACPLCTRRRGGLRTAAQRAAPTKFTSEEAGRTPKDEGIADAADLPRSARGRHADADAPASTPATGLRLKLPATAEAAGPTEQQGLPVTWRRTTVNALVQIMQQPEATLFSAPVSNADAPGYSSVVSRPMDLGTIKSRLQRKKYLHPAEVYADIRQVWTNCRLYNAEGSDIARACKRLEKHALSAWKDSNLPRKLGSAGQPQALEAELPAADAPLPSWGGARRGKRAAQAHDAEPEGIPAEQAAAAAKVLKSLMRHRAAAPFLQPVSEEAAPGYNSVIKHPMDLGTVLQGLESRSYASIGAVLGDVGLVWQNCRGFNAEGSDIHAMADEAEAHFVQLWARKDLPFEAVDPLPAPPSAGKHGLLTGPEGSQRRKRPREEQPEAAAEQPAPEEDAGRQKRSRTGRIIVPPGRPEEAVTPIKSEEPAASKRRGTLHTDAMPLQTPEPEQARQGGRRTAKKRARKPDWPPAAAGQLAAAQKVVKGVAKGESGWPFAVPVTDDVAPGYSTEISRPMDLGSVATSLKLGAYVTLGALLDDVALVWANCRQYNEPTSELLPLCTAAEADFWQRWQDAGLPTEPQEPVMDQAAEPASPAEGQTKRGGRAKADLLVSTATAGADQNNSNTAAAAPAVLSGAERRRQKASLRAAAAAEDAPQQDLAGALPEAGLGVSLEPEKANTDAGSGADIEADDLTQEAPEQRPLKKRRRFGIATPMAAQATVFAETPGEDGSPSQADADAQAGTGAAKSTGSPEEEREQTGEPTDGDGEMGRHAAAISDEGLPSVLAATPGLKVRLKRKQ